MYKYNPFTMVDAPDSAAIIFCDGCQLRCKYCYNIELLKESNNGLSKYQIIDKIKEINNGNFNTVDWIVLSGGEPLQKDIEELKSFLITAKSLDIKTAIYTNGIEHEKLHTLIKENLLDMVHIDYKHYNYNAINNTEIDSPYNNTRVLLSLKIAYDAFIEKKISYFYINTTVAGSIHSSKDLLYMKSQIFSITNEIPIITEQLFEKNIAWKLTSFNNNYGSIPTLGNLKYNENWISKEDLVNIIQGVK